jgi:hypothetical protein
MSQLLDLNLENHFDVTIIGWTCNRKFESRQNLRTAKRTRQSYQGDYRSKKRIAKSRYNSYNPKEFEVRKYNKRLYSFTSDLI